MDIDVDDTEIIMMAIVNGLVPRDRFPDLIRWNDLARAENHRSLGIDRVHTCAADRYRGEPAYIECDFGYNPDADTLYCDCRGRIPDA